MLQKATYLNFHLLQGSVSCRHDNRWGYIILSCCRPNSHFYTEDKFNRRRAYRTPGGFLYSKMVGRSWYLLGFKISIFGTS